MPRDHTLDPFRARRRLRMRRRGKRAYIRSVYFLPSLATLGNAICGFAAIYVVTMSPGTSGLDPVAQMFAQNRFLTAAYLILLAMLFDALDGRLARWARHTTDFGGQLDSMADVISFGAAPAMIALALFKHDFEHVQLPLILSRFVWAIGAIYASCAAIRLARFNVSNEHGEQNHMSFLGLPSPGAAAAVIGLVLIQQDLHLEAVSRNSHTFHMLARACTIALPLVVLASGLLMVSGFRYPHLVNKHLRGKRTIGRLVMALALIGLLITAHRYTFGIGSILYALVIPIWWLLLQYRARASRGVETP
ncbi:MAG: CDP-alcohol phosphatidyltransferase family protein [Burkholderiales bacterium]|nr:CDP-alcohol phosphatidyltransferase family protein [Phycisphaerae bacterium]